jgi:hypothetical protein
VDERSVQLAVQQFDGQLFEGVPLVVGLLFSPFDCLPPYGTMLTWLSR